MEVQNMPQPTVIVDPKLEFLLSVDRLLNAAEQVRHVRDQLLQSVRTPQVSEASQGDPDPQEATP
jgi:hypothetical protein